MRQRRGREEVLSGCTFPSNVTWDIDFTDSFRADLVGLDEDVEQAVVDTLIGWLEAGPPRENARTLADIDFFEEPVAEAFLLAYSVDSLRRRFVVLWLRRRPGVARRP